MKINRFEVVTGTCIEEITGQSCLGYSVSDTSDFYDVACWPEEEEYPGSTITFYDYTNGKIYEPFARECNVMYGKPAFLEDAYWILQGNYNSGLVTLYKYFPSETPEAVTQLNIADVDPYNLSIMGEKVHIISEDDEFVCYYPEACRFVKESRESACLISDGKVYLSSWTEEGWDDERDCATPEYRYYEKLVVRDFDGNLISEESGCLQMRADGTWWLA